jgi:FkbM family methyltransferase
MARLTGRGGHVYAFEPQPENAAFVRRAVARRGLAGRVTVEVAALLAESGPVELFPARTGGSSEWTVDRNFAAREDTAPVDRRPITVAAVALDDYLPDGQRVDVVKLDVEGAEGQAISGMLETLGTHSPVLVVEFHHYDWSAVELLLDAGYGLFDLDGSPVRRLRELDDVPYHFLARK